MATAEEQYLTLSKTLMLMILDVTERSTAVMMLLRRSGVILQEDYNTILEGTRGHYRAARERIETMTFQSARDVLESFEGPIQ